MIPTITQAYFSLDLYNKLSIRSKELLISYKEYLKTFSLGNSVLIFSKNKKYRNFYNYFKENKVDEFFETLINYIKYNYFQYNPLVISYLYGMISNYVFTTMTSPYTIYKTHNNSYMINNYIDNYMISIRENMNPYYFKCYKACFNTDKLNKALVEVMDFTYKETFGIENFHLIYLDSIKRMRKYYRIFRYDPYGIKKGIYKTFDLITKSKNKEYISYHNKSNKEVLNLDRNIWYNPTDKRTKSNDSYLELYIKALNKTNNIIHEINSFFYYDTKINIKKIIGNLNYNTGKNCNNSKEIKFFEN